MDNPHNNKMSSGEITVPASSFQQRTDMNIQPTAVNVAVGGLPQHWLNTAPYSKRDMTTNSTPTRVGSNPRVYKVLRFNEYMESNK